MGTGDACEGIVSKSVVLEQGCDVQCCFEAGTPVPFSIWSEIWRWNVHECSDRYADVRFLALDFCVLWFNTSPFEHRTIPPQQKNPPYCMTDDVFTQVLVILLNGNWWWNYQTIIQDNSRTQSIGVRFNKQSFILQQNVRTVPFFLPLTEMLSCRRAFNLDLERSRTRCPTILSNSGWATMEDA